MTSVVGDGMMVSICYTMLCGGGAYVVNTFVDFTAVQLRQSVFELFFIGTFTYCCASGCWWCLKGEGVYCLFVYFELGCFSSLDFSNM